MSQLVTFSRANNIVTIDLGDHKVFANTDLYVSTKPGRDLIFLSKDFSSGKPVMLLTFNVTDINGRPDDDPVNVAEWLKSTYFYGPIYGTGGGGGGDASAANQLLQIAELQDIEVDIESGNTVRQGISDKMQSGMVSEAHDNKQIVYVSSGPATGEIDYVSYKVGVTEVARLTMSYDGTGNLTGITKT